MIIKTHRLKLVACTAEFVSSITPENYEIREHVKGYVDELGKDNYLFGWGVWFVVEKESNKIVGDIGFKGKPSSDQTVEIGYGIVPAAQNKGYATEGVEALIEWAFRSGEVKKIIAECFNDNFASRKVLEKLGMKQTGQDSDMLKWEMTEVHGEPSKT